MKISLFYSKANNRIILIVKAMRCKFPISTVSKFFKQNIISHDND